MDRSLATAPPAAPFAPLATPPLPTRRAIVWLRDALRVLRRAPVRILLLAFAPILFEAACQMLPQVGIVLSKLLTPLAGAYALALLDRRMRHGAFGPAAALRTWAPRVPALLGVALAFVVVFAVQVATAAALAGPANAWALATGAVADLHMQRAQLAIVLAAGCVPGLALTYVLPRVLFDGLGPVEAIVDNARVLARTWKPVLALTGASTAMVAAVVAWPWILLLLLPMGFTVGYAMYRDVFHAPVD